MIFIWSTLFCVRKSLIASRILIYSCPSWHSLHIWNWPWDKNKVHIWPWVGCRTKWHTRTAKLPFNLKFLECLSSLTCRDCADLSKVQERFQRRMEQKRRASIASESKDSSEPGYSLISMPFYRLSSFQPSIRLSLTPPYFFSSLTSPYFFSGERFLYQECFWMILSVFLNKTEN